MFIIGIGTAAPPYRYTQPDCWQALQRSSRFDELNSRSRAVLRKILTGNNGIGSRHFSVSSLEQIFDLTPDVLHARFADNGPALATLAAERALANANTRAEEIDAVLISTCTGYLCPGLTSYVAERLNLRPDVFAMDLVGQGCGAALPNFRAAEALLSSGNCDRVLSVCVEICTAAFFLDNDVGVLVSACLFGDGAGAVVLSNSPADLRRIEWKAGASFLAPADRDLLRFEQKGGMLRNILTPEVPALAAGHASRVFEDTLARLNIGRSEISGWIFHPGGRDVLMALREKLGLSGEDLRWSEAILHEYGNVSSASVIFVLEAALSDSVPPGYWWMCSFGAGFSCHGGLLTVGDAR